MTDLYLTIAAAVFEVGTAAAVLCAIVMGRMRPQAVVILGTITPAIVFMARIAYEQCTRPAIGNMASAGWVMGSIAYMLLLFAGIAISFVPRPSNLYARYLLGLGLTPVLFWMLRIE